MSRSTFKVAAATVAFVLVHSLLATGWVKALAADVFGRPAADAWYRPVYVAQTLALLGLLVLYVRRQPGRDLYRARGPLAWLMRAAQAAALVYAGWAVAHVGLDFMTGWDRAAAWVRGADVPPMPDGQGPVPGSDGTMRAAGPFAHTRHPLNWFLVPLLWLNPRMTTRLLAFNLVVTAYAVLGSVLLENRLLGTYGDAYRRYQERVPFLGPNP